MGFASKFANKALLDQSRSKALVRRRLNGRATDLYPRKSKSFLRGINSRRYRNVATVRQRAVLDGVGTKFVEDHCKRRGCCGTIVLIGGKKQATNWMNRSQLRRAVRNAC